MLSNPNAPMSMRLFPISPERKRDKKTPFYADADADADVCCVNAGNAGNAGNACAEEWCKC